jgi:glycosyl transferase family 25
MTSSLPRVNDKFIDKIIYINLDHRIDRRASVERQLSVFSPEKIIRLSAVYTPESGFFGCAMSHIKALHIALINQFKNVLIVEDDFIWNNLEDNYCIFQYLATTKKYDVISLGGPEDICYDKETLRTTQTQAPVAYLVNNHYFDLLCCHYMKSVELLQQYYYPTAFAIDQYWKMLQPKGNWYVVRPILCYQLGGFSDIGNTFEQIKQSDTSNTNINTLSDFFNSQMINLYVRLYKTQLSPSLVPNFDRFTQCKEFNISLESDIELFSSTIKNCCLDILFLDGDFNDEEISKVSFCFKQTRYLIILANQVSSPLVSEGWKPFLKNSSYGLLMNSAL